MCPRSSSMAVTYHGAPEPRYLLPEEHLEIGNISFQWLQEVAAVTAMDSGHLQVLQHMLQADWFRSFEDRFSCEDDDSHPLDMLKPLLLHAAQARNLAAAKLLLQAHPELLQYAIESLQTAQTHKRQPDKIKQLLQLSVELQEEGR